MAATSTRSHFSSAGMTFACAKLDVLSIPHLTLFISITFHGVIVFHFPFSILHLSFAIARNRTVRAMANDKCNMENGKCLKIFAGLLMSFHKQLPAFFPIVILRAGEVLLVIVNGRLAEGVAGIVILAAELARVPDRLEHREDAETALRFGRLEHRVDRRGGLSADVQEADGEEPVAVVGANLPVAARLDRRLFGKEVVDRIGNVLFESLAMAIEQPLLDLVYERVADDDPEVPISAPDAPLAARRREFRQIDAQRHDRAEAARVTRRRIAKEVIPEMPPAEPPQ